MGNPQPRLLEITIRFNDYSKYPKTFCYGEMGTNGFLGIMYREDIVWTYRKL